MQRLSEKGSGVFILNNLMNLFRHRKSYFFATPITNNWINSMFLPYFVLGYNILSTLDYLFASQSPLKVMSSIYFLNPKSLNKDP